jgi:NitT/TauT family transport system substrate-binding protein
MQPKRIVRAAGCVISCLTLSVSAVACGSSSSKSTSTTGASAKATVTTLNVNLIPIPDLAPIYVGVKQGFFAQNHLKLNITKSPSGGPAVIPAVVSGHAQIGAPAWSDLILAVAHGLPLVGIASSDAAGPTNATDYQYLVTTKGSGVTNLKQLAGKTIAINSLNGLGQVQVDAALEKVGVNYKSVHFVAINFPQQGAALKAGRVAAAQMVEPFITLLKTQGTPPIKLAGLDYAVAPNLPVAAFLTSKSYYASHLSVIKEFQAAIAESQKYIEAHPDSARQVVPGYTGVPAALAKQILMPYYPSTTNTAGVQALDNDMQKFGIISKAPPLSSFVKVGS